METITREFNPPAGSIILNNFDKYDYCDSFGVTINDNSSIDKLASLIFVVPAWVKLLMGLRNAIVKLFGLKTGRGVKLNKADYYPVGSRAVIFTVIFRNDNEIVVSESDKHLVFRASIMKCGNGNDSSVKLTTIVRYNNFGGRLYFFFVKPFHRVIMKSLLKRL